jgi:GNAT superfamily N-acetyltransferase
MKFIFLADRPEMAPAVAKWYFDQWGHLAPEGSEQKIFERIRNSIHRDKAPLMILAIDEKTQNGDAHHGEVMGCAELKIREMTLYPEFEFWLGGVYVTSKYRGHGVASAIATKIYELAESFGVERIYLQTEQLNGGLYAKLGWEKLWQVNYRGVDVAVMEKKLSPKHHDFIVEKMENRIV